MSFALFQQTIDRAVSGAGTYVLQIVDKLTTVDNNAPRPEAASPAALSSDDNCSRISELPADVLARIFTYLDADTLAGVAPLVCKAWRAEIFRPALWCDRIPSKVLAHVDALSALGDTVSAPHLYLALSGRNFLRNPAFRRECNTQLLELGRPTWNKWSRDAWVLGHATEHQLDWEARPEGFTSANGCGDDAPLPPVPYGGGGVRLGERMQQQLRGLLGGLSGAWDGADQQQQQQQSLAQQQSSQQPAEQQPDGTPAPAPVPCIATTADWCEVMQLVDLHWELQRRGLTAAQAAHLLDAGLSLRFSVYVGSRSDSLGQFCVGLLLDEGGAGNAVPQMQSFVLRPGRHSYFSGRVRCSGVDRWQRFEYVVPACPRGFRRAFVLLRGRRSPSPNPPAGTGVGAGAAASTAESLPVFCGAKFACAELMFGA